MTVRPCLPWPDRRLRTPAAPVAAITDDIRAIWDDMIDTMEAMPGVSALIARPRAVTVRFMDQAGAVVERDFVGIEATSVQHQIDHLNGAMYFDRLSKVKRDMLLRKARKRNG